MKTKIYKSKNYKSRTVRRRTVGPTVRRRTVRAPSDRPLTCRDVSGDFWENFAVLVA